MDQPAQPLSDQEQIMLGAQQVALLQIHDSELETRAQQQHAMLEEEKLLEAQKEALALQQQQRLQAQERAEQQKEAELHHLQTLAMIEKEKEMLQQTATAIPARMEGPPPSAPPPAVITQPAQPVVFMHPATATDPMISHPTTQQQQTPVSLAIQSQVRVMAPPQIISAPIHGTAPGQETQYGGAGMQDSPFSGRGPTAPEAQFPNQTVQVAAESGFTNQGQPPVHEPSFGACGTPATMQEPIHFGGQTQTTSATPAMLTGPVPTPPGDNLPAQIQKTSEPVKVGTMPKAGPDQQTAAAAKSEQGQPQQKEIKLPQALEKVLAFKDVRAQQVGIKLEDVEKLEKGELIHDNTEDQDLGITQEAIQEDVNEVEEEDEDIAKQTKKESKNKKRKKKKKRAKARNTANSDDGEKSSSLQEKQPEEDVQIEYVEDEVPIDKSDPSYAEFAKIFQAFKIAEPVVTEPSKEVEKKEEVKKEEIPIKARGLIVDDSDDEEDQRVGPDDKPKLSKKKQKKLNRLSVAELKQLVSRPDVVEMHDVTARDPKLLVHIKATRNSVPVPRHWCFKRKYLQGKRGIEKPPFDLPDFIKATGIMEMRLALQEKEDQKTMKSRMRERVRPKMGKIDIDYKKLHDAFFKWQVKPKLSIHGDLYYEGKEFETRLKEKKPGNLSDELRTALGMPIGPNCDKYPPPWLIAMQRYGPPPSYPNLKIPGLNAPIPDGCSFGYHAGGWGKPPVDESGKPLYGDVFGTQTAETEVPIQEEEVDKSHWGELESESEEEEESEEESEEEDVDTTGLVTPGDAGLVTPSGVTSIPMGVETPDMIELRKKRIEDAMDQGGDTPALYQVLPEKKATVGGGMMGSSHIYDISAVAAGKKAPEKVAVEAVEVALNPDELDLDTAAMQAKYEQTVREQQSQLEKEDLSDMVAEHAAKQQKKRKKQQQDGKAQKKYKEFKF